MQQEGATAVTPSPTLTWKDPGTGATVTARLSRTWFVTRVDGTTAQTLRIAYTDWAGQRQNAWLVGNPADGYTFIRYALPGDAGAPAAPADQSTCLTSGDCSYSAAIEYVGGDGLKYTASVRAPARPAGAPAYSAPEEGSPATFEANGFGPAGAVAPVAYRWRFQKTGCITPGGLTGCQVALNDGTVTGNYGPDYSAPVAGETVAFTWDASGPAQVELTATDAAGATVTTAFPVAVANAPPTVGLTPDCPGGSCVPRTVEMGIPVRLQGWARDPAARDALRVTIDWGDGSEHQHGCTSGGCFGLLGGVDLGSDGFRAGLDITLASTHTYATVGIYHGMVWVTDDGGADSEPFTITIADPPPLAIPAVPAQTIGGFALVVPAMGGHSRLPVSLAVTGDPGVCAVTTNPVTVAVARALAGAAGAGGPAGVRADVVLVMLRPGTCEVTASQVSDGVHPAAPPATRSFTVQLPQLTVTASSASVVYGGQAPAVTASYSGFLRGDTVASLDTRATCTVAPNSGAAGSYATTCSGAADPSYGFAYVPGTLTITKAPLTVTANDQTRPYGGALPAFDARYAGLLNGDGAGVVGGLTCGAAEAGGTPVGSGTPVGQYPITCAGGAAANYALTYQPGTLTITRAASAVTVATAPPAPVAGQPVTLTASVSVQGGSGPVGGTVEFRAGGAAIAGCASQPVDAASGTATCTTSALGAAAHSLTAAYSGDANLLASTSAVAALTVASAPAARAASTVTLAPAAPSVRGQAVTFTAAVAPAAPGAGTPTGTVTFYDGDKSLGTGQLTAVGGAFQATLSAGGLAVGPHTITARYGGDGGFLESASAARTHHVNTDLSAFPRLPGGAYNLKRGAGLAGGSFVGVSLAGASLIGADLTGAVLTGADLTGANLSSADLRGADLSTANLRGATGLQTATLTGAVWGTTTCPDGTTSDQNGGTCLGHL